MDQLTNKLSQTLSVILLFFSFVQGKAQVCMSACVEDCPHTVKGQCTNGEIRLVMTSSKFEGGIEVCVNGEWGTVCNDFWGTNEARVACRQLGFHISGKRYLNTLYS